MQLSIAEIKEIRFGNSRGSNNNFVAERWERSFNVLDIFWEMERSGEWNENVYVCIYEEEDQQQVNNSSSLFHPKIELDKEVDELRKLMHVFKRSYIRVKWKINCAIGLTVRNCEGKASGVLQHKIWKPGRLWPIVKCNGS